MHHYFSSSPATFKDIKQNEPFNRNFVSVNQNTILLIMKSDLQQWCGLCMLGASVGRVYLWTTTTQWALSDGLIIIPKDGPETIRLNFDLKL